MGEGTASRHHRRTATMTTTVTHTVEGAVEEAAGGITRRHRLRPPRDKGRARLPIPESTVNITAGEGGETRGVAEVAEAGGSIRIREMITAEVETITLNNIKEDLT